MKIRTLLLLIVLGSMVPLTAMAYASPPDPTWLGGFFDDDDDDDVMALIASSSATLDPFPLAAFSPAPPNVGAVLSIDDTRLVTRALSGVKARAPPLA